MVLPAVGCPSNEHKSVVVGIREIISPLHTEECFLSRLLIFNILYEFVIKRG